MPDRLKNAAAILIAALAGALVIVALASTGGPIYARQEYRDGIRSRGLYEIERFVGCVVAKNDALPQTLEPVTGCELPELEDPFTGKPYRYKALDANAVRICADFELPIEKRRARGSGVTAADDPQCVDFVVVDRNGYRLDGAPLMDAP